MLSRVSRLGHYKMGYSFIGHISVYVYVQFLRVRGKAYSFYQILKAVCDPFPGPLKF